MVRKKLFKSYNINIKFGYELIYTKNQAEKIMNIATKNTVNLIEQKETKLPKTLKFLLTKLSEAPLIIIPLELEKIEGI